MPSTSHFKKRVLIIQEHTPHYRKRFFNDLKESLAASGVQLDLAHGRETINRVISGTPDWAYTVRIQKIGPFMWHHLGNLCQNVDLIIAPQEMKYLHCHFLFLSSRIFKIRFAYWGHGRNFQARNPHSLSERLKGLLSRHVDWWFAYNSLSAGIIRDLGFPPERITSVGNAIDTRGLIERKRSLNQADLDAVRKGLNLSSSNVAVYTGGLYATKRIEFLLKSAFLIRELIPDFELIVIGSGPDHDLVTAAANKVTWIHDVGPKNDDEKVPYWALSKLLLMPGGVGLAILDSFALGVPMVTTDTELHGPEIAYLETGINGLLVSCGESASIYAQAVADLLNSPDDLEKLRRGARSAAAEHSIENMVQNFSEGILQSLSIPKGRRLVR